MMLPAALLDKFDVLRKARCTAGADSGSSAAGGGLGPASSGEAGCDATGGSAGARGTVAVSSSVVIKGIGGSLDMSGRVPPRD